MRKSRSCVWHPLRSNKIAKKAALEQVGRDSIRLAKKPCPNCGFEFLLARDAKQFSSILCFKCGLLLPSAVRILNIKTGRRVRF